MDEGNEGWALIPEEYRETNFVKEAPDFGAMIKTSIEAQSLLGSSVRIPGDGASDEVKAEFNTKMSDLGLFQKEQAAEMLRPATSDAYQLAAVPSNANELGLSQPMIDAWKEEAYAMGLSQTQFESLAGGRVKGMEARMESQTEHHRATTAALEERWGPQGYEARKRMALNAVKRFGGDELYDRMSTNPDADFLAMMADVGAKFEETGMGDLTTPPLLTETPDEAARKLSEINNNPDHPFNQGMYKAGTRAYDVGASEVMRLRAIMRGEKPTTGDYMFAETG